MVNVKYPVSEQNFRNLRNNGYLYVDKTEYIHRLATPGGYFFLSRPRRFGKSLLISTMEEFFRGNRELFKGLAIDRLQPEEWTCHPVLHLDFMQGGYREPNDLTGVLSDTLDRWEKEYGEPHHNESPDRRFKKIIMSAYERTGQQVVVLIDEYDSPIIDASDNPELEVQNRKTLHDFYRVMKSCAGYLKFVFLTGVGKLGQISVFSGLKNIQDISLRREYSAICGITTKELLSNFREGIESLAMRHGWSFDDTLQRLKEQYDGYHFSEEMIDIYNPYSLLNALNAEVIIDYWFQSGTPTRLVQQFLKQNWSTDDLEGAVASESALISGDVLGDSLILTCFYTGYLTIKAYDSEYQEFTLGYPNTEVRTGFFNCLLQAVKGWDKVRTDNFVTSLNRFIRKGDIDGFLHELQSFFAGIPYMNHTDKESQWQKDILIISRLVGLNAEVEKRTSDGRIDMILDTPDAIFILEFKLDKSPEEALKQINEKRYSLQFENGPNTKRIVKVAVNISSSTRNIDSWLIA